MARHALFLSVQPRYAWRILEGKKTVELRRVRPRAHEGTILLLYVSSPVKALQAVSTVQSITSGHPEVLWRRVGSDAGLTQAEFRDYFDGAQKGFAIRLGEVRRLSRPLTLADLRKVWPGFNPPQVYQYFTEWEFAALSSVLSDDGSGDATAIISCRVAA